MLVPPRNSFDFSSDIPIIRSPEMMLIEIEANARLGKESEASTILFSLQQNRDPDQFPEILETI